MNKTRTVIQIEEQSTQLLENLDHVFSNLELEIIESKFKGLVEISIKSNNKFKLRTFQHVGFIILPNHLINIIPKIPKLSFINMVKYAIELPFLDETKLKLTQDTNYYDLIILFLFEEIKKLLTNGLITGYQNYEENSSVVRGKILFKQNLNLNFNNPSKIFCTFSERSVDVIENRIIKYTLFYLSKYPNLQDYMNKELLTYYKSFDDVSLSVITSSELLSIEYTPLNHQYKNIIKLCELILQDVSLNMEHMEGNTSINSFLIDMNNLFEKCVLNLLKDKMKDIQDLKIDGQRTEYVDTEMKIPVRFDIVMYLKNRPALIMDTKYMEYKSKPESSHVAQINLYSDIIKTTDCCLIYPGNKDFTILNLEKIGITLYVIFIDLSAESKEKFAEYCNNFIRTLRSIVFKADNHD